MKTKHEINLYRNNEFTLLERIKDSKAGVIIILKESFSEFHEKWLMLYV